MYSRRVFTVAEAAREAGLTKRATHRRLSYLTTAGYFTKVRRGLYAVRPLEDRARPEPTNPYLIACRLTGPYVLSHHTALEVHGVAHSAFNLVCVSTPRRFRPFTHEGLRYRPVLTPTRELVAARQVRRIEDQEVQVASPAWALVQCVRRPDLAGGVEETMRSVEGFSALRAAEVLRAARLVAQRSLFNRLGFVLSRFAERWDVTPSVLKAFTARRSTFVGYFGTHPGRARYVREWRLMVPASVAEATDRG